MGASLACVRTLLRTARPAPGSRDGALLGTGLSRRGPHRLVVQDRGEPAFGLGQRPALAAGVVGRLVALDLADAEVVRVGMGEVEAGDRRRRSHGEAFGEL